MKIKLFSFSFLLILCSVFFTQKSMANSQEELIKTEGLVPITKIVSKFEAQNNKKLMLPTEFPFEISNSGGHFVGEDGLTLSWFNNEKRLHLFIRVSGEKNFKFIDPDKANKIALKNGIDAFYTKTDKYNKLVFEKNGLEYCILLALKTKIDKPELIQIAESFK